MRDTPTAARWLRDPDAAGERYAGWTLVSTEDGRALADIVPVWAGAARDSGAPTDWRAAVHGEPIGEFGGVNAAKAAIRATLTSTPRRPHRALTPSPGPFGGPLAGARRRPY